MLCGFVDECFLVAALLLKVMMGLALLGHKLYIKRGLNKLLAA